MWLLVVSAGLAYAEDFPSLLARGDALDAKLENRQALEVFQQAEKLEPQNVMLICRISRQYGLMMVDAANAEEKKALAEKALAAATHALAVDPKNPSSQLAAAICYGRIAPFLENKTKLAYSKLCKDHADEALALDPANDLTYYVLGSWNLEVSRLGAFTRTMARMIYGEMPPASFEKAREYFEKALKLNARRVGTHVELGRTLAELGKKAEARKELNTALQLPVREKDDAEAKDRAANALKGL